VPAGSDPGEANDRLGLAPQDWWNHSWGSTWTGGPWPQLQTDAVHRSSASALAYSVNTSSSAPRRERRRRPFKLRFAGAALLVTGDERGVGVGFAVLYRCRRNGWGGVRY
jgi:hypothetical protein